MFGYWGKCFETFTCSSMSWMFHLLLREMIHFTFKQVTRPFTCCWKKSFPIHLFIDIVHLVITGFWNERIELFTVLWQNWLEQKKFTNGCCCQICVQYRYCRSWSVPAYAAYSKPQLHNFGCDHTQKYITRPAGADGGIYWLKTWAHACGMYRLVTAQKFSSSFVQSALCAIWSKREWSNCALRRHVTLQ